MSSDTPRTDRMLRTHGEYHVIQLCRDLERELAQLQSKLAEIETNAQIEIDRLGDGKYAAEQRAEEHARCVRELRKQGADIRSTAITEDDYDTSNLCHILAFWLESNPPKGEV